jgi:hypothetical protein
MKIDDDMREQLLNLYDKNKDIVNALGMIGEVTTAGSVGPSYTTKLEISEKLGKNPKEIPQYSGGGFVKFKPCAYPNDTKKNTPNCDQGRSIEYPIKTTKHNIISPSLN